MKKWIGILLCAALLAALPALAQQAGDIGAEQAKRIALTHAGIADPASAFILKAEKDLENGRTVYEVEFCGGRQGIRLRYRRLYRPDSDL